MKKINNLERITSIYPAWKPSDIAFVKSVEWASHCLTMVAYCQLRGNESGWPDMATDFFEIKLDFHSVSNLRLDFPGNGWQQISGFNILDVSANGLENINFQIEDYENGVIGFNCEAIEIIAVSAPVSL
ncbi:hypothetical protein [Chitinophaga sp.]|uniref:hypothetical protein n=1 Tax=Chitinophaga sp. TaxID=1869181 RepID=UPI002F93ED51